MTVRYVVKRYVFRKVETQEIVAGSEEQARDQLAQFVPDPREWELVDVRDP